MSGIRTKREKHVVYALSIHHQDLREERHSIEDRVQEWEGMVSKVSRSGRGISSGQQNRVRHEGRHFESIDECRDSRHSQV